MATTHGLRDGEVLAGTRFGEVADHARRVAAAAFVPGRAHTTGQLRHLHAPQ